MIPESFLINLILNYSSRVRPSTIKLIVPGELAPEIKDR
jgi:hypothetical protein